MSNQIEIKEPIKLLKKDGSLTQPGWCRNNIIDYNREDVTAPKWRIKEWDFYQVSCKDYMVQINFFNISLFSAALVVYEDFKTGEKVNDMILDIGTINRLQVNRNGDKPYSFEHTKGNKSVKIVVTEDERTLFWKSPKLEAEYKLQNYKGESICIMTPFKTPNRFFFTQKINCMPAKGYVKFGGKEIIGDRGDLFGVLDWGRGAWEYKNFWFWGNGTTYINDKLFGFEITWGIGIEDDATETSLMYDGKCHKLGKVDVEYQPDGRWMEPWKFHEENGRFELTMTPFYDHEDGLIFLGLVGLKAHQVHGLWNGTVTLDDGTVLEIKDMYAFCEKVYNKW